MADVRAQLERLVIEEAGKLGWPVVDRFAVDGRPQVVVDAGGLRLALLAPWEDAGSEEAT
jgi:hypothetical protein